MSIIMVALWQMRSDLYSFNQFSLASITSVALKHNSPRPNPTVLLSTVIQQTICAMVQPYTVVPKTICLSLFSGKEA